MPFEVGTKDCTALSDAELAEMADLCVDRAPGFDIGFLSKQCEEWVLVSLVREGTKLRGLFVLHAGAHRRDAVAARRAWPPSTGRSRPSRPCGSLLGDQYRRALLAFPDEDVLVGTRLASCEGSSSFAGLADVVPGPGTRPRVRSGPGAAVWPSASVPRVGSTTAPSSWPATARRPVPSTWAAPRCRSPPTTWPRCSRA